MSLLLLQAAEGRRLDDVIELVAEGASVNYQNPDQSTDGHTALIEATLNLDTRMMRWLLENAIQDSDISMGSELDDTMGALRL